ncbi:MAG: MarR family transcriptional regulator [Hyphomicrobiales bacterium]|nr:MarR family transcriptional regulator [Hyphomicrobiales bacterium]
MAAKRKAPVEERASEGFRPPLTISRKALLDAQGDAHFREILYLMVTAFGRLLACRDAFGRSADLTGSQFAVLMGAAYTQGATGVTIAALAAHVQLAATHVTTEVGRLVTRGLLEKQNNPKDRRSVLVRLTGEGEQVVQGLAPFMRSINDILFDGVGRQEFAELEQFLVRFARQSDLALSEISRREKPAS